MKLLQQEFQEEDLKKVSYLGKVPYQEVHDIKKSNNCVFPSFAETLMIPLNQWQCKSQWSTVI
jgi:hypothetical protein